MTESFQQLSAFFERIPLDILYVVGNVIFKDVQKRIAQIKVYFPSLVSVCLFRHYRCLPQHTRNISKGLVT